MTLEMVHVSFYKLFMTVILYFDWFNVYLYYLIVWWCWVNTLLPNNGEQYILDILLNNRILGSKIIIISIFDEDNYAQWIVSNFGIFLYFILIILKFSVCYEI